MPKATPSVHGRAQLEVSALCPGASRALIFPFSPAGTEAWRLLRCRDPLRWTSHPCLPSGPGWGMHLSSHFPVLGFPESSELTLAEGPEPWLCASVVPVLEAPSAVPAPPPPHDETQVIVTVTAWDSATGQPLCPALSPPRLHSGSHGLGGGCLVLSVFIPSKLTICGL